MIIKREPANMEIVIRDKIKNYSKTITLRSKETVENIKAKIEKVLR